MELDLEIVVYEIGVWVAWVLGKLAGGWLTLWTGSWGHVGRLKLWCEMNRC